MSSFLTTAPLPRVPLVPQSILKDHGVACIIDSRFRAAARLLQHLWLRDNGIPTGHHIRKDGDGDVVIPLESLLSPEAARAGRNFISPAVHTFVRRELIMREEGACYDEERLFGNALSSMPMCFNIFAPLAMDLELATVTFRLLLPNFVKQVHSLRFETAPSRERDRTDTRFLMDGSAWDLAIEITDLEGDRATVFAECKFSETMDGPPARPRERYVTAAREVELYNDPDSPVLSSVACEQFFREHALSQLAVNAGLTPRAMFVVIAPRLNRRVQAAIRIYANELIPEEELDYDRVRFQAITLETVIDAIRQAGAVDLAKMLWGRYCDFERIFHLSMTETGGDQSSRSNSAAAPPPSSRKRSRRGNDVESNHA
ncbi:hypothetical protein [Tardiphaga sp. P9-11]|uniref:PGN_0703 family putative restriction endonuclease n=1 Tax=Tardiphaga sp. P9-11 TaxID=2024614 RepID=UPI0011F18DD8|nr:hypothetical protein [Tardiphaga sp. P9-11]KAA0070408.1 hypothetical protein CIW50_27590 [Tardiphaga sp. P9-11]